MSLERTPVRIPDAPCREAVMSSMGVVALQRVVYASQMMNEGLCNFRRC